MRILEAKISLNNREYRVYNGGEPGLVLATGPGIPGDKCEASGCDVEPRAFDLANHIALAACGERKHRPGSISRTVGSLTYRNADGDQQPAANLCNSEITEIADLITRISG